MVFITAFQNQKDKLTFPILLRGRERFLIHKLAIRLMVNGLQQFLQGEVPLRKIRYSGNIVINYCWVSQ